MRPTSLPGSLPVPPAGDPDATLAWVAAHLGDLAAEPPDALIASPRFRGGQHHADEALAALDVSRYASRRNQVLPDSARGATAISPYVRHGLVGLRQLWDRVADAPAKDSRKYRDELLWQEYARHLYARMGSALATPLRHLPTEGDAPSMTPWPPEMACMQAMVTELERDGWLVNQSRMWMSSQWTVRAGMNWRDGEDRFFTHLLDGSRAANRLGWQWTVGTGTSRPYGFSRWQVQKRAPSLCASCALNENCPIAGWPRAPAGPRAERIDPRLYADPDLGRTTGPDDVQRRSEPTTLTAESLGKGDAALAVDANRPAVFVFDEPLLATLRLSSKRLVFLAETLAEIAQGRDLAVLRGSPVECLSGIKLAVTFAPVPGFRRRSARMQIAELHPWPWLAPPHAGSIASFSTWRRRIRVS